MKNCIQMATVLGFASLLLAGPAQAGESGFYLGAGAGQARMADTAPNGQEVSENSTPYRAFAGYRLGMIPIFDFAAEIGYMDLGKAEGTAAQFEAKGADASILVILPITIVDLYGRFGVMQVELDKTYNGTTTSSSGSAGVYGAGIGLRFGPIGVRAEYNRIDIPELESTDVGMVSAYFQF